mgnify:FL=1|jgi:hypothetical protein|tara:strand:- start:384 stop:773 length:390 start_codon:yes stop_codon:yes gene_type:complete
MAVIDDINKSIEDMRKMFSERDRLIEELEASIAIQSVWPEAFDGEGSVKARWVTDENRKTFLKFYRSDDASKTKTIPLEEVPDPILRQHAKIRGITGAQYEMHPHPQRPLMNSAENRAIWKAMNKKRGK